MSSDWTIDGPDLCWRMLNGFRPDRQQSRSVLACVEQPQTQPPTVQILLNTFRLDHQQSRSVLTQGEWLQTRPLTVPIHAGTCRMASAWTANSPDPSSADPSQVCGHFGLRPTMFHTPCLALSPHRSTLPVSNQSLHSHFW